MINWFRKLLNNTGEVKTEPIKTEPIKKEFNIDEFNDWFKTEFDGYDGHKGAPGIYRRCDKLSQYWVEDYLKHIGQDPNGSSKYYNIVRKNWRYGN